MAWDDPARAERVKERQERAAAWIDRMAAGADQTGASLARWGVRLTLLVTIPVIVTVVTFPLGLFLGPLAALIIWQVIRQRPTAS